jgi:hypothetical protein
LRQSPQEVKDSTTWSHSGDGGADGLDDPGSLVPEYSGQRERQSAARDTEVGVAQAAGHDPDEGLVGAGCVELDVGEGEGRAPGLDHGCTGGGGHRRNSSFR